MRSTPVMSESQFHIILQSHLIDPYGDLLTEHLNETLIPGFDDDDPFYMPMTEAARDIAGLIPENGFINTDNGIETTGSGVAYLPADICDEDGNAVESIALYFDSSANAVRALITDGTSAPSLNVTGRLTDDDLLGIVKTLEARLAAFIEENGIDLDGLGFESAGWNYDENGDPEFEC